MSDEAIVRMNSRSVGAGDRRWQQVLAFGCLPDGCEVVDESAGAAMPSVVFDVLP